MEVNKQIYPDITENENFTYSNFLSNYSRGLSDLSCVYSSSTSNYAIKSEGIIAGRYTTPKTNLFFPISNRTGQNFIMVNVGSGAGSYPANSYNTIVENSFNPFNDTHDIYSKIQLVTGFKYYSVCAVPYVVYSGSSNTVSLAPAKTYFDSYTNRKILGVAIRLYAGTNKNRSLSTSLTLVNTFNYTPAILKKITDEGAENDKYAIDSTLDVQMLNSHYSNGTITQMIGCCNYPYSSFKIGTVTGHPFLNINSPFVNINNKITADWSGSFGGVIPEITLTKNDVMHICATTGLIFTDDTAIAGNLDLTNDDNIENENLYFPVKTGDLWQGEFVHGSANKNTEQYKNDWNANKNSPFTQGSKPVSQTDPTIYGDDGLTNNAGNTSALTHRYLLTNSELKTVSTYLNNIDDNLLTAIVNNIKMSGDSPINSIVSIQYIPFDISTYAPAVADIVIGSNLINIGTVDAPVALSANVVTADSIILDLGECYITPKNENYLDYEPYTKYICYIPFCNFVELDAGIVNDKKLSFSLVCDLVGGTCEGIIRVNGRIYKTVDGIFSTQCSVQGVDSASYINSLVTTTGKYVGGVGAMVGAVAGVATGGVSTAVATAGILAGSGTVASSLYEFNTTPKEFTSIGKSVGLIGQRLPQHVCIYRYFCEDITDENFKNFAGYACNFVTRLGNLTGFTKCGNVQLNGFNATIQEKEEIKMLLETGVII